MTDLSKLTNKWLVFALRCATVDRLNATHFGGDRNTAQEEAERLEAELLHRLSKPQDPKVTALLDALRRSHKTDPQMDGSSKLRGVDYVNFERLVLPAIAAFTPADASERSGT